LGRGVRGFGLEAGFGLAFAAGFGFGFGFGGTLPAARRQLLRS
jgi:hypothetical protein